MTASNESSVGSGTASSEGGFRVRLEELGPGMTGGEGRGTGVSEFGSDEKRTLVRAVGVLVSERRSEDWVGLEVEEEEAKGLG
jgi:hypothetical protein